MNLGDNLLPKQSVRFLHRITQTFTNLPPILKSYYGCRYRVLEKRSNVSISTNRAEVMKTCPKCSLRYTHTEVANVIKPEKKKSKFAGKVLHKDFNDKLLTRYQAKYLQKIRRIRQNQLVCTCNFCKMESSYFITKPPGIKPNGETKKSIELPEKSKKKKKKKKDRFCGLNSDAVLSIQPIQPISKPKNGRADITSHGRKKMKQTVSKLTEILTTLPEKKNVTNNLVHFLTSR